MPVIKLVQRGTLNIKDKTTETTKIIAVDMTKSELKWDGTATNAEYTGYYHVYVEFNDSSTLTAHRSLLSEQEFIHWEITEYV